MRISKSTIK